MTARRALAAAVLVCLLLAAALARVPRGGPASAPPGIGSAARGGLAPAGGIASLPSSAQAAVSRALGADDHAYQVRNSHAGLLATNLRHGLRARFTSSGVALHAGMLRLSLSLRSVGYGDRPQPVGEVAPKASANRVTYARGAVSEWYANGPLGLEQGFLLTRPPRDVSSQPLTLAMKISANARTSLLASGQALTLARPGGPSLRYGGLHATDAGGRSLHTWLAVRPGTILLRVDARGARYPLRIDPLLQQGDKLSVGEGSTPAAFGVSVALSADGNTALIGAPQNNNLAGAAWVFTRSGGTWTQQGAKLIAGEEGGAEEEQQCEQEPGEAGGGCAFGRSVALSADGNTALVGSPRETGLCPSPTEPARECRYQGAVWVFTRSGSVWARQGPPLTGGGEETVFGRFGRSLSVSADGNTALIGAPADRGGRGSAWVFTRSGTTWAQQGTKIVGGEEVGEGYFGIGLALSADGNTAIIGAPGDTGRLGAAWAFARSGSSWEQQGGKLTGGGEIGEARFGRSVALAASGEVALVGGYTDNNRVGAAWSFSRAGATWSEDEKLTGRGETGAGFFGFGVALSPDGNSALIGAPADRGRIGAVWAFTRSGLTWSQQGERLTGGNEAGKARFGYSVALSFAGDTAMIGGPDDAEKMGAAWAFAQGEGPPPEKEEPPEEEASNGLRPRVLEVIPREGPAAGGTTVTINGVRLTGATAVSFGSTPAMSFAPVAGGSITAVSPPHQPGTVDVTVTRRGLTSNTSENDRFTYTGQLNSGPGAAGAGGPSGGGVLGFTASGAGASCRVSLLSRRIAVQSRGRGRGRAAVKLLSTGPGACRGTLRLTVKTMTGHRRSRSRVIASSAFAIPAGRITSLALKLNSTGRALLSQGHGRLNASLVIVKLSPGPVQARSASVRVALQRAPRRPR